MSNLTLPDDLILRPLKEAEKQGHAFLHLHELLAALSQNPQLDEEDQRRLLDQAIRSGAVILEGDRVYLEQIKRAEDNVVDFLLNGTWTSPVMLRSYPQGLNPEQLAAIQTALTHRLSIITGGAGTGKSHLIGSLLSAFGDPQSCLLCAPTGKAAKVLSESTGYHAQTIHRTLGLYRDQDLTRPARDLSSYRLIVVDEASMLTLPMAAGIFNAVGPDCKVVLVGDCNQLPPVGSGMLFSELMDLGIPTARLRRVYRQSDQASSLFQNVTRFSEVHSVYDLQFDRSFQLIQAKNEDIPSLTTEIFSQHIKNSEAVVLSPFREYSNLSVHSLNSSLQSALLLPGTPCLSGDKDTFYQHDRVMFTRNNRLAGYVNGETGRLTLQDSGTWAVQSGKSIPVTTQTLDHLALSYAMTIHKSQGSAFDTVILPISTDMTFLLTRNLIYTAITRARKQVVLIGDPNTISHGLSNPVQKRNSFLTARLLRLPAA